MDREIKRLRSQSSALTKQEDKFDKKQQGVLKELQEARSQIASLETSLQAKLTDLECLQQQHSQVRVPDR